MGQAALVAAAAIEVHRGPRSVLEGVSIDLREGEVVAVLGENGSGKTTLIEACAGILPLRSGRVTWRTESGAERVVRDSEGRRTAPPSMGLTLQKDGMCGEETVKERLATALSVAGRDPSGDDISSLLDAWGLEHRSDDRISQLSGGLRRRLSLLCGLAPAALSAGSRAVLLDEPSEGLDDGAKALLRGWLRGLASNGHGVLVATHDRDVIACADRLISIRGGVLDETTGESTGEPIALPNACPPAEPSQIGSLIRWAFRMERRNPIDTVGRATPAIVAMLLAYSLVGNLDMGLHGSGLLAALVLAPAFITAVASPALVRRLAEADCGRWWNAAVGPMARPANSIAGASLVLPIPLTYLSWFVLAGSFDPDASSEVLRWLWLPALSMLDLAVAAAALHLLVSDLRRANAAAASLLLVVLIWPFLELTDALATIMNEGMTFGLEIGDPITTCLIASTTSALIWLVAIFIPDA